MRCRSRLFKSSKSWSFWNSWRCCWCFRNSVDMVLKKTVFSRLFYIQTVVIRDFWTNSKIETLWMIPANFWKEVTADKSCYTPQKLYNMSSKRKYIEPNPLIFRGQKKSLVFRCFRRREKGTADWQTDDSSKVSSKVAPAGSPPGRSSSKSSPPQGRGLKNHCRGHVEGQWKGRPFKQVRWLQKIIQQWSNNHPEFVLDLLLT